MNKKEHLTNVVNGLLLDELGKIKAIKEEIEGLLKADGIDVELKAIRVFESMQKIKFNSEIFRSIKEMKEE